MPSNLCFISGTGKKIAGKGLAAKMVSEGWGRLLSLYRGVLGSKREKELGWNS